MVHLPIDRDVVAEVILGHQAPAHVHPDLFQVSRTDDAVRVHIAGPQGQQCSTGSAKRSFEETLNLLSGTQSKLLWPANSTDLQCVVVLLPKAGHVAADFPSQAK